MYDGNESAELLEHYGEPIKALLDDPRVTEICVNGHKEVQVEREGRLMLTDARWAEEADLINFIRQIAHSLGQEVNAANPILDARLADNTRINATLPPISLDGPSMSIRPFPRVVFTLEELMARGAIPPDAAELLELGVLNRLNIMVSGGTGSGKTTVLRCIIQMVPKEERLVIAEDTAENLAPNHPHKRSFEAPRRKLAGAAARITMTDLIVNMLRQRPDRPIVGEVRTPEACAALVDAINTGHDGMASTIHSNGGEDTFDRLALLYARQALNISFETIHAIIRKNIDLVVHVGRDQERIGDEIKATRRLKEIVWVHDGKPRHLLRHTRRRGYQYDEAAISEYKDLLALG